MLVKVSKNYAGIYGAMNPKTHSIMPMTNVSSPFDVNDELAKRHIAKGILIPADQKEAIPDNTEEKISTEIVEDIPDVIEEDNEVEEDSEIDIESMNMSELKAYAKELGITYRVGMSKADLKKAIKDLDEEEIPVIEASSPV